MIFGHHVVQEASKNEIMTNFKFKYCTYCVQYQHSTVISIPLHCRKSTLVCILYSIIDRCRFLPIWWMDLLLFRCLFSINTVMKILVMMKMMKRTETTKVPVCKPVQYGLLGRIQ